MIKVAKLAIVDNDNKYLLLYRSDHPRFGSDPDIAGGIVEDGESMREAMVREVQEEIGVAIDGSNALEVYSGSEYSEHGTEYTLFMIKMDTRPDVVMSWEHSRYEWLDCADFLRTAKSANDTYMHMVANVLSKLDLAL